MYKFKRRDILPALVKRLELSPTKFMKPFERRKSLISLIFRDVIQAATDILWKQICRQKLKPTKLPQFDFTDAMQKCFFKVLHVPKDCVTTKLINFLKTEVLLKVFFMLKCGHVISLVNVNRKTVTDVNELARIVNDFTRKISRRLGRQKIISPRKGLKRINKASQKGTRNFKPLATKVNDRTDVWSQRNTAQTEIANQVKYVSNVLNATMTVLRLLLNSETCFDRAQDIWFRLTKYVHYTSDENKIMDQSDRNRVPVLRSLTDSLSQFFGSGNEAICALKQPTYDQVLMDCIKDLLSLSRVSTTEMVLEQFIQDLERLQDS